MFYKLLPQRRSRKKTEYIIVTQAKNFFIQGTVIPEFVKHGTYKITSRIWEEYFYKLINPMLIGIGSEDHGLPYHYYAELVGDDYMIFNGNPDFTYSYFLKHLIQARIIPGKYLNSIVIAINENFSLDIPEKRLMSMIAHRAVVPAILRKDYDVTPDKVVYIDDIVDWDMLGDRIGNSVLPYVIEKTNLYHHDYLYREVIKQKAYVSKY